MGRAEAHPRDGQGCSGRPTAPSSPPTARPPLLATVVSVKEPKPGQDFFPLTVNYQGALLRSRPHSGRLLEREGRPTEK